jgi:acyl carrier protein
LSEASVEERVLTIIKRSLPPRATPGPLARQQRLRDDLAIDSMGLMTIAYRIEEQFGIGIMRWAESMRAIHTIGDVVDFVRESCDARN